MALHCSVTKRAAQNISKPPCPVWLLATTPTTLQKAGTICSLPATLGSILGLKVASKKRVIGRPSQVVFFINMANKIWQRGPFLLSYFVGSTP